MMHIKKTALPDEKAKLLHIRIGSVLFIGINFAYLISGFFDGRAYKYTTVAAMILLQLAFLVIFWKKLKKLSMYSTLIWIVHLSLYVFILQPANPGFHYYLTGIPILLGFIDEFRNLYSRYISLLSLVLYNISIVWLTSLEIAKGEQAVVAIVGYANQLLVGLMLFYAFPVFFLFNRNSLQKATNESMMDTLTNTYNRRALEADMDFNHQNMRRRGAYLVMMDIDNFKLVNDRFGHQAGDGVLTAIAEIVSSSVRSSDRLYRYGGEEFLLIVGDIEENDALEVAEKLRVKIESQSWELLHGEKVTCSFGVAPLPRDCPFKEALEQADTAAIPNVEIA